jgi:hypothetical protein
VKTAHQAITSGGELISIYIEQNNEQDECNNINNEQHRMMPSLAIKKARGSSSSLFTAASSPAGWFAARWTAGTDVAADG